MRQLLVCALAALGASAALAEPFVPAGEEQVLERLREPGDMEARELRRQRQALAEQPDDLEAAIRLARRYLALGRAEADPRYQGYAQAALRRWWDLPRPPPEVLVLRATVRQSRHDFDGALADLGQVIAAQPSNAQAWLSRAVILEVRGEPAAAMQSCLALQRLTHPLTAAACLGSAGSLNGQAAISAQMLRQALRSHPDASAAERLWAMTVLAEIAARLGDERGAEQHFRDALALGLRDAYLIGAFADFLLDLERPAEVAALLATDTRPDGLLLRLAVAEQRLGSPELDRHAGSLRARFAAGRMRGDNQHLRNEARFLLHVIGAPDQALPIAKLNWRTQREPWDARLLLEAADAVGDPAAARPVLEWLADTKLEDVRLRRMAVRLDGPTR